MPFVNVKIVKSVFSGEEKHAVAAALSDVTVRFKGLEAFREIVRVLRVEPQTAGCRIGGEPFRSPASLMDRPARGKAAHESIGGLQAAVGEDFTDNTLLPGRPQGPTGLSFAPAKFRGAVPDLTCELLEVLAVGDRITARPVFRGRFTGTVDGTAGAGQAVECNAVDIQHADSEKIVEDWHMEADQAPAAQLSAGSPATNRAEEGVWIR